MSTKTSAITPTSTQTRLQLTTPQSSGLVNLPPELLIKILRMLSMKEFGSLNQTCHQISYVTTNAAPFHLLSHFYPNFQKTDPDQTDLKALKQGHITHSNLTKGVYVSHTLQAHNQSVDALAIDGRRLVSGSRDNTIKIWDLNTNTCTAILEGHRDYVRCLVLNGQRLISASDDRTIKIWDLTTNTCTTTLQEYDDPNYLLAQDGGRLFSACLGKTIKIWDFTAPDEDVFKEIAELMTSKDPSIAEVAMDRFDRMPPKAKNAIYQELLEILGSCANDDGQDTFDNQHEQISTPDQMAQAIFNYLAKSTRS